MDFYFQRTDVTHLKIPALSKKSYKVLLHTWQNMKINANKSNSKSERGQMKSKSNTNIYVYLKKRDLKDITDSLNMNSL